MGDERLLDIFTEEEIRVLDVLLERVITIAAPYEDEEYMDVIESIKHKLPSNHDTD